MGADESSAARDDDAALLLRRQVAHRRVPFGRRCDLGLRVEADQVRARFIGEVEALQLVQRDLVGDDEGGEPG